MINLTPNALIQSVQGFLLGDRTPQPTQQPVADAWTPQFGATQAWKVISIRQPYAWLIANGVKDVENRTWTTPYRGPVLIHAGKALDPDHKGLCAAMREDGLGAPATFDRGGIVGVATITGIITQRRHRGDDWFQGPYGWILENPRPLPFMALKGQLQLFTIQYPTILNY